MWDPWETIQRIAILILGLALAFPILAYLLFAALPTREKQPPQQNKRSAEVLLVAMHIGEN